MLSAKERRDYHNAINAMKNDKVRITRTFCFHAVDYKGNHSQSDHKTFDSSTKLFPNPHSVIIIY
jgi:hypothetical protein